MSGSPESAERGRRAALRRALDYLQAVGLPADEALEAASAALKAAKGSERPLAEMMRQLRGLSGRDDVLGAPAPSRPLQPVGRAAPPDDLALHAGSPDACGLACSTPPLLRGHMTPETMDRSPWRTPLQKFDAWLVLASATVSNSRMGWTAAHAVLVVPPYFLGGPI